MLTDTATISLPSCLPGRCRPRCPTQLTSPFLLTTMTTISWDHQGLDLKGTRTSLGPSLAAPTRCCCTRECSLLVHRPLLLHPRCCSRRAAPSRKVQGMLQEESWDKQQATQPHPRFQASLAVLRQRLASGPWRELRAVHLAPWLGLLSEP
jgi:hypothetical protein